MDAAKRQQQMRRDVTALRHQFTQGGSGVFSEVLAGADAAHVINTDPDPLDTPAAGCDLRP